MDVATLIATQLLKIRQFKREDILLQWQYNNDSYFVQKHNKKYVCKNAHLLEINGSKVQTSLKKYLLLPEKR